MKLHSITDAHTMINNSGFAGFNFAIECIDDDAFLEKVGVELWRNVPSSREAEDLDVWIALIACARQVSLFYDCASFIPFYSFLFFVSSTNLFFPPFLFSFIA